MVEAENFSDHHRSAVSLFCVALFSKANIFKAKNILNCNYAYELWVSNFQNQIFIRCKAAVFIKDYLCVLI